MAVSVSKSCVNEFTYGVACVKCGKCGRAFTSCGIDDSKIKERDRVVSLKDLSGVRVPVFQGK